MLNRELWVEEVEVEELIRRLYLRDSLELLEEMAMSY
jgi:hypothetical protein